MPEIRLRLDIPESECLKYYAGAAQEVFAYSVEGKKVKFPARILRPYITRHGVQGEFIIRFDERGRFQSIRCLSG